MKTKFRTRFGTKRLIWTVLFISLFSLSTTWAQTVTLNYEGEKLENVLSAIKAQTGYSFVFSEQLLDVNRRISINVKAAPLKKTLTELLIGTNLTSEIKNKYIYFIKDEKNSNASSPQEKKITGVVTSEDGEPIIGANVINEATKVGTITDLDGKFALETATKSTLLISYIGYTTQQVKVSNANTYNIVLVADTKILDEVVVTALGIKRAEKALSYNVQELKGDELTVAKDANFMNSLSGKVAGVTINASSGGVGGAVRVVMRGTKSISNDNNALYVIDGIPILNVSQGSTDGEYGLAGGEGISDINPEDIESMTVLTGASAAALYGSDAANGVVVINTKKGKTGKPRITISNNTTFSNPFILPKFQNRYSNKEGVYASWGEKLEQSTGFEPVDFFNTGVNIQNNISLSTGNERQQTYLSVGTTNAGGILPNHEYDRYNFTFRSTTKFWNDKLSLDYGGSYIAQNDQNMSAQGKYFNPLTSLYTFPRGEDFSAIRAYERFDAERNMSLQYWPWGDQAMNMQNPYWVQYRNMRTSNRTRYMLNANVKYDINKWLNVAGRVRMDNTVAENEKKYNASTIELFAGENGTYRSTKQVIKLLYTDLLLNLDKRVGEFNLSANLGSSMSREESDLVGGGGKLEIANYFALHNVQKLYRTFDQSRSHSMLTMSAFINAEIGWKSMLYLTLTARNDWASSLSNTESLSFFYPSAGLSAIVSEMVKLPKFVSYLKVRAAYAEVGAALPKYLSTPTYKFNDMSGYYETYTRLVPDKLYPELTQSWEAGVNAKFFGNKLTMDLTLYKSNTDKQTFEIPISATSGYSSMIVQSGRVENKGIEAAIGVNLQWRDWGWSSGVTYSLNRNKVQSMVPYYTTPDGKVSSLNKITKSSIDGGSAEFVLMTGGTMGDLWTKNVLKKDEDGNIWINSSNKLEIATKAQKVGSVLPKYNLGWNNNFSWKNVKLGFLLSARVGGKALSATQAYLDGYGVSEESAKARDKGGITVNQGKVSAETWYQTIGTGKVFSHYIYDATNIRLQEANIGYTIPKKWLSNICSIDLSLVGRNLWMIYNKAPFDPEATASTGTYYQGIDYFMQPSLRSYGFNVKINF